MVQIDIQLLTTSIVQTLAKCRVKSLKTNFHKLFFIMKNDINMYRMSHFWGVKSVARRIPSKNRTVYCPCRIYREWMISCSIPLGSLIKGKALNNHRGFQGRNCQRDLFSDSYGSVGSLHSTAFGEVMICSCTLRMSWGRCQWGNLEFSMYFI